MKPLPFTGILGVDGGGIGQFRESGKNLYHCVNLDYFYEEKI
jgi:hypothetical protein